MARIVVIFGTTDGQTAKVAQHVTDVLRSEQHIVELIDTRGASWEAPRPAAG